jgi:hypothetical protein
MPLPPYVWQNNDFVSASRLTAELRQTLGQFYQPNGVRFHALRPVYKNYAKNGFTPVASAGWNGLYSTTTGNYTVQVDTASTSSGPVDPLCYGGMAGGSLATAGGATGSAGAGGLALAWSSVPYNAVASTYAQAGLYDTDNSSNIIGSGGTVQPIGTTTYPPTSWALDLVDWGQHSPSGGFFKTATATLAASSSPDGSGGPTARTSAFWASMYPANGTVLAGSSLPTIQSSLVNGNSVTPAMLNASIGQAMSLLNMPPAFRANCSVSLASGTSTLVNYASPTYDTYSAWNTSTSTYTCPLPGLYLVYSVGGYATAPGGWTQQALKINGSFAHTGPAYGTVAGQPVASATARIFSLQAGDTIQQYINCATATATSALSPTLVILWLGATGQPLNNGLPAPDTTFNYAAGLPGSQVAGMLTNNVLYDIQRLIYRPYAMGWQSTAQTVTASTFNVQNLDTYTCPVHGDNTDIYGSFYNSQWTASLSGWYLVCYENYAASIAGAAPVAIAGIAPWPPGQNTIDYQQVNMVPNGSFGGGATMLGLFYLRAGDSIIPQHWSTATATYTNGSGTYSPHMEAVWISE